MSKNHIDYADVLADLRTKREALSREIKGLDSVINNLENLGSIGSPAHSSISRPVNSNIQSYEEGAVYLLEQEGSPMRTRAIVDGLGKIGVEIKAQNPLTSVFSSLNKGSMKTNSKIKKLKDGSWGLKERD